MTMQQAIELFAAINFMVIGLSHVFQHRAWAEFFLLLHRQGKPGVFANGFITLLIGTLIVSFHNVWSGIPIILTLIGWGQIAKSTIIFVQPEWGLRSMGRAKDKDPRVFIIPGIFLIVVALLLGYSLWETWPAPLPNS